MVFRTIDLQLFHFRGEVLHQSAINLLFTTAAAAATSVSNVVYATTTAFGTYSLVTTWQS
jgi:hypothetical protein